MSEKRLKRKKLLNKLFLKNRLVILNEDTFEEIFSFKLNLMNVFVMATLGAISLIALTTVIIAFTPLREFIPGYSSSKLKKDATELALKSDSLSAALSKNEAYIKSIQNQYSWQNNFELPLGTFTLAYDRLEQDLKTSYAYQGKSRDSNGYYFGYLKDIGAHSIQTNFRLEDSTQYGKNTTGYLGYGYRINPNWRATTSYGTAFKAPTFNDVYAPPYWGADPNIKPEESENIEASLRYSNETSLASVTLYKNKITNLILSSGATGIPAYQMGNIGNAELKGVTIAASTSINGWSCLLYTSDAADE